MRSKKIVAALSAAAMLGSLAVAVPASAKTVPGDTGAVAAAVSAQVRAKDSSFTDKNSVAIKTDGAAIEMTQKDGVYFGAYYAFDADALNIPAGAAVTSATLTITKYDSFNRRSFNVIGFGVDDAASINADTIFNAVSAAYSTATAVTAEETAVDSAAPIVADVTSIFDAAKDNAFFVTNKTVENNKRNLKADATLQVTYTYEEPDDPVAQIGDTKYESFEAAFAAAKANDTIELLADVETEGRFVLDSGTANAPTYKNNISPLTIKGNGHTITAKAANKFAFLFETNGKTLTLDNITIVNGRTYVINAKGSSTINLTDATVPANTLNTNNANSKVNAANLNVAAAADGVSLFNSGSTLGTLNIALTEALAAQYDVVDGVLTAKAVEEPKAEASNNGFKYVTGADDSKAAYTTVTVTVPTGAAFSGLKVLVNNVARTGTLKSGTILTNADAVYGVIVTNVTSADTVVIDVE